MAQKVIAIDGPAGSGKSTIASALAKRLCFVHLNSGLLYRAVAHAALRQGVTLDDEERLAALSAELKFQFTLDREGETQFLIDGAPADKALSSQQVSEAASQVALLPKVRTTLSAVQRETADVASVVVEGRDAGTNVFPDTPHKFYLEASPLERARRRLEQLGSGEGRTLASVKADIEARDERDRNRAHVPHKQAEDAQVVITEGLTVEEVVDKLYKSIS